MPGPFFNKSAADPIYSNARNHKKHRVPVYEDPSVRYGMDKNEYVRQLRHQQQLQYAYQMGPKSYDSLKLMQSQNDSPYLESFMTLPRDSKNGASKAKVPSKSPVVKSANKEKSKKANAPVGQTAVSLAMLNSLRSSASEDNLYESVEMIHYLKTKQSMDRQVKTRSIQKSGHSLFDHLRVEQALKQPATAAPIRRNSTVDRMYTLPSSHRGHSTDSPSPNHSCSSSGDEYETFYKAPSREQRKISAPAMFASKHKSRYVAKVESTRPSESDEDWRMIPRPLFMKGIVSPRRKQPEPSPYALSDESDSSAKSFGSR